MPKLPQITGNQLARAARRGGYVFHRQEGSHASYRHPDSGVVIVIPVGPKPLKMGTLSGIIKRAGWSREELLSLLK